MSSAPANLSRARDVFVVDSEDPFRRKATRILERQGHSVIFCSSISTTIEALSSYTPSLIIMELSLGKNASIDLYKLVRENDDTFHIPFLFTLRGDDYTPFLQNIPIEERYVLKKPFTAMKYLYFAQQIFDRLDLINKYSESDFFSGSLNDITIYDIIGLISSYKKTGELFLWPPDKKTKAIFVFEDGVLLNASYGAIEGRDVGMDLMLWPGGFFQFQPVLNLSLYNGLSGNGNIDTNTWQEIYDFIKLVDRSNLNPYPISLKEQLKEEILLDEILIGNVSDDAIHTDSIIISDNDKNDFNSDILVKQEESDLDSNLIVDDLEQQYESFFEKFLDSTSLAGLDLSLDYPDLLPIDFTRNVASKELSDILLDGDEIIMNDSDMVENSKREEVVYKGRLRDEWLELELPVPKDWSDGSFLEEANNEYKYDTTEEQPILLTNFTETEEIAEKTETDSNFFSKKDEIKKSGEKNEVVDN